MKKLFVFCLIAILLLSGCVANEKNDLYDETPIPTLTPSPENTEIPVITATPEETQIPVITEAPITTPTIEATPDTSKGVKKYVNTDKINVRKGNSTTTDKIGTLSKGDEVIAYSTQEGWIYICFDENKYGYVSEKYLSDTKPLMQTPTAAPTKAPATPTVKPTEVPITPTAEPTKNPTAKPFLSPSTTPKDDESFDLVDDML